MPRPDPVPALRHATLTRFRRILRLLALFAVVIAAIAVLLVARDGGSEHAHLLVATALGVGLTVLVGSGLMALAFLSASSGHDEEASRTPQEDER